jgi:hypothetical protein
MVESSSEENKRIMMKMKGSMMRRKLLFIKKFNKYMSKRRPFKGDEGEGKVKESVL